MSSYSDEELEKFMAAFDAIPLHRHYGLRFSRVPGEPCVSFDVTPELSSGLDYLHGGVLYAVLDIAAAAAVVPKLRRGVQEKTVDLAITMIRSARVGETVDLYAEVEHIGRSNAFVRVVARQRRDGKLVARAQATKAFIELDKIAAAEALERGETVRT